MRRSVEFNYEPRLATGEVRNERTDRILSLKSISMQLLALQLGPKDYFGLCQP